MRIDDIDIGDEVTITDAAIVPGDPPPRMRVTAIEPRQDNRYDGRMYRKVLVEELEWDTGDVMPAGEVAGRHSFSRTGRWWHARDLDPMAPVKERYDAAVADRDDVVATTAALIAAFDTFRIPGPFHVRRASPYRRDTFVIELTRDGVAALTDVLDYAERQRLAGR